MYEREKCSEIFSQKIDIFSLGAIFFQLLNNGSSVTFTGQEKQYRYGQTINYFDKNILN